MARLRNFVRKNGPRGFRAVLFRMVPKLEARLDLANVSFRAVLFRMVPKPGGLALEARVCFRAVLFRMVSKLVATKYEYNKPPPSSSLGGVIYVGHRFAMS